MSFDSLPLAPQRIQQPTQRIMVDLIHQFQQLAQFAARESLARKPRKIMAGKFRNLLPLVFTEGHFADE